MIRVLTFTSLFPNAEQPRHGIFVETRVRKLVASGEVDARVVAPVPWPSRGAGGRRIGAGRAMPESARRNGLTVCHPRFLAPPGLPSVSAATMALTALPVLRRLIREGFDFDLIDAHFYYPDGVAAVLLGRWLGKPVVITARGSDITYWPTRWPARAMIRWAGRAAARNAGVSRTLVDEMVRLGFPAGHFPVLRNGVDLDLFHEDGRSETRALLGIEGSVALSVGNLIELKGHHLAIEAVAALPQVQLVIVGSGPEEGKLSALAKRLGVDARVRLVGVVPQELLRRYYSAADVLILASSREGWPNVLLEAMACGTPVVATNVGGIPDIVAAPEAGMLIDQRTALALREGIRRVLEAGIDRRCTRRYAECFGWEPTTRAQLRLFRDVVAQAHPGRSRPSPGTGGDGDHRWAEED